MRTQGIRFENGPKLHPFVITDEPFIINSKVVVQSPRGLEIGIVRSAERPSEESYGEVVRLANPDDLHIWDELGKRAHELKWFLRARARERGMGAKIVAVEFILNGNEVHISLSGERLDLRRLAQDIASQTKAKPHFHTVSTREQARIFGTLGVCGEENCSSLHLQDFLPVTIRMSRDQQLPLNPEKISGPCGRLLCCLQYEHELYKELLAELPRKGARVCSTEGTCGKVIKLNPLKGTVEVLSDEGQSFEARADQLHPGSAKESATSNE